MRMFWTMRPPKRSTGSTTNPRVGPRATAGRPANCLTGDGKMLGASKPGGLGVASSNLAAPTISRSSRSVAGHARSALGFREARPFQLLPLVAQVTAQDVREAGAVAALEGVEDGLVLA